MRKDDPKYPEWYARHRLVENARVNRIKEEQNPVVVLDDNDRGPLPETCSLEELFWHPSDCDCGPCMSPMKSAIKRIHAQQRPLLPSIRATLPHPPLSDHLLRLLQDVSEEVLSQVGS